VALRAAFAKTFDFNSYVTALKSSSHSFYHTATLRGVCEDLIVLKAIKDITTEDRSNLVMYLQLNEMFSTMRTQGKFFKSNHHQIVLDEEYANKMSQDEFGKAMALYKKHGLVASRILCKRSSLVLGRCSFS